MALLLFAVIAFLVMRFAVPPWKSAGNVRLAMFAVPCAVAGWLLLSLITNVTLLTR